MQNQQVTYVFKGSRGTRNLLSSTDDGINIFGTPQGRARCRCGVDDSPSRYSLMAPHTRTVMSPPVEGGAASSGSET